MSTHQCIAEHDHAIAINYHSALLERKLLSHGCKPSLVYAKMYADREAFERVQQEDAPAEDSYAEQLAMAIQNCPARPDAEGFTQYINRLVFLWLNAMQQGARAGTLLKQLHCLTIRSVFNTAQTASFHRFLFDLMAETMQQYQQSTIHYLLHFDAATKLPYSDRMIDALNQLTTAVEDNAIVAVFSMRFLSAKRQASTHLIQTALNQCIAARLQQHLREHTTLYVNGDAQFDILITKLDSVVPLNLYAAKLIRAFEEMLSINAHSVFLTPYIGCAHTTCGEQSIMDLPLNAKLALENAIDEQKNLVFYSLAHRQAFSAQQQLEGKVLDAFSSDNLTLFFQPIVDIAHLKCVGAELLLRWAIDTESHVYPSSTIEILNKVGKGKLFTRWLINSACRYASELQNEHQMPLYLTLNLRAEDLYDIELPHLLTQAVKLWKINTDAIILEITENGILEYNEHSNSVIQQLTDAGFKFALDDFGTGFSSLTRLRTMPIDLIKIDQSFVRDIAHSKEDFEIVQSIAALAKSLGKEVLAEGVEDEACLTKIKAIQIDKCQGYFFGKPMSFEHFIAWVKAQHSLN